MVKRLLTLSIAVVIVLMIATIGRYFGAYEGHWYGRR